jgi:hypothetical protein
MASLLAFSETASTQVTSSFLLPNPKDAFCFHLPWLFSTLDTINYFPSINLFPWLPHFPCLPNPQAIPQLALWVPLYIFYLYPLPFIMLLFKILLAPFSLCALTLSLLHSLTQQGHTM